VKSDSVYLFVVLWIAVVAEFILHVQQNEDAAGDAYGQSHEVYQRVSFVAFEIAECGFDVVF
jgi:hypothetical protein